MPEVSISIPTLLQDCTGGERQIKLEAATVQDALQHLFDSYPLLKVHLLDTKGKLKPHLVILSEGLPIKPFDQSDMPLSKNQELHIMQAVSGG